MNLVEISNNFCISYLACIRKIAAKLNLSLSQALCLNAMNPIAVITTAFTKVYTK